MSDKFDLILTYKERWVIAGYSMLPYVNFTIAKLDITFDAKFVDRNSLWTR